MQHFSKTILYGLSFFLFSGLLAAQDMVTVPAEIAAYPDMIVYNGKVVTMDDQSFGLNTPIGTIGQAMAIRGSTIQAIGTNDRILKMAGPKTDKIDLKGRMVMPGIVDTHSHIHNNELNYWVGKHPDVVKETSEAYSVSGKTDAELEQGVTAAVKEHVSKTPAGRWAFISVGTSGGGGSGLGPGVSFLGRGRFNMQMLDKIAPNHPIMLQSHPSYVMNSAGLKGIQKLYPGPISMELAGIDEMGRVRGTAPQYYRGLTIDGYFNDKVPQLAEIVKDGLAKNAAVGITTYVSHIMGQRFLDAFNLLAREHRMPIRFGYTHWYGFAAGYAEAANFYRRMGDMAGMGDPDQFLYYDAVGLGSIDSGPPRFCSTMEAPKMVKEMEFCQNFEGTVMFEATKTAFANYERVAVGHSYADKGIDYYMDAMDAAMKQNPAITIDYIRSRRPSSDHCGFYPRKEQLPRLAKYGYTISCSGGVLSRSYPWTQNNRYAPEYVNRIAPIKSAIEAGVRVTMENEAGVAGNVSRSYFYEAAPFITRKNEYGAVVAPEEAVDRNTVLKMMTSWAARYAIKEEVLGTLEKGKLADFLVLNKDVVTVPIEEWGSVFPLMTVVGGKVQALRDEFAKELGKQPVGFQIEFNNKMRYSSAE